MKKDLDNISKYQEHKKLFLLKKPKAVNSVLFCTKDLPDEWLIDMIVFQTKSGKIVDDAMITQKDLNYQLEYYKNIGYTEI